MTHAQLMRLHIATLFRLDEQGRLVAVNELGYPSPPRFFMGRTTAGNFWHFRQDLPGPICQALEALCQAEAIADDLRSLPQRHQAIREVLEEDASVQQEYRGPAYRLPEVVPNDPRARLLDRDTLHLVQPHFPWLLRTGEFEHAAPVAAVVEAGEAVTICFCSRIPGRATEAGLNTVETYRGKGYGAAAVACWANALGEQGCIPLYSTSWDNLASQAVARKLGMVCYGEDWSVD